MAGSLRTRFALAGIFNTEEQKLPIRYCRHLNANDWIFLLGKPMTGPAVLFLGVSVTRIMVRLAGAHAVTFFLTFDWTAVITRGRPADRGVRAPGGIKLKTSARLRMLFPPSFGEVKGAGTLRVR